MFFFVSVEKKKGFYVFLIYYFCGIILQTVDVFHKVKWKMPP